MSFSFKFLSFQRAAIRLARRVPNAGAKRYYGTIQQGGGGWAKRATAEEEKFIHEHELEVLANLKAKQAKSTSSDSKVASQSRAADSNPAADLSNETFAQTNTPESLGFSPASTRSGVFGKREGALEDQWIREHEREKK